MDQPVKEFVFVCTAGTPGNPNHRVYLQLGGVCEVQATLVLTPLQAAELSRELHDAAEAASKGEFYESE